MPKPKEFYADKLPRSVAGIAVSIIADYDRRAYAISYTTLPDDVRREYERLQQIVDSAFMIVESRDRGEFRRDIAFGRGWEISKLQSTYSKGAYYRRKRCVVFAAAQLLLLV